MSWTLLLPVAVAIGVILNGLRIRARAGGLTVLAAAGEPVPDDARFVLGDGVRLDEGTAKAAAAHAAKTGVAVLDLIPENLHIVPALDLLREVDPAKYRGDRLAAGRGAGQVTYADATVLERAGGIPPKSRETDAVRPTSKDEPTPPEPEQPGASPFDQAGETGGRRLDLGEFVRFSAHLKPYAAADTDLAVATQLRAAPYRVGRRRSAIRALGTPLYFVLTLPMLSYGLIALSIVLNPVAGVVAAVVYSLQPYLIFAGGPLRPRGLHTAALLRVVREPYVWVRTAVGPWRSQVEIEEDQVREEARIGYFKELSDGTERFLEERRTDCAWCGSESLETMVCSGDLVQRKPGRFTLERCGSCGHVFQNPRLSLDGLDFYYRDFYDGLGATVADTLFRGSAESYEGRATMVAPFGTPKSWLDVGTGHAHFCSYSREIWPETTFDGLDLGAGIEEAARRGWISKGYRGLFPDLAGDLIGCYDVVSMHHYLEHTRDPFAELDAAAKVLLPGGHLLIELPDPEWPLAKPLGRFWMPWFAPQHQHMISLGNLKRALAERGLTPVAEERAAANQVNDFVLAAYLAISQLTPDLDGPWSRTKPTWWRRAWRGGVWLVGVPILIGCAGLDQIMNRYACHRDLGNAYRVLARKDDSG